MQGALHVVAGVLWRGNDVLLAERRLSDPEQSVWEFPGGKVEPAESACAALQRELQEELDVKVEQSEPLIRLFHPRENSCPLLLDVWSVTRFSGSPTGVEGQRLRWCVVESIDTAPMFAADRGVVAALKLPRRCVVMSYDESAWPNGRRFWGELERCFEARIMVRLSVRTVNSQAHAIIARACQLKERFAGAKLILDGTPSLAAANCADGVYFARDAASLLRARPLGRKQLFGVCCHDLVDLLHATHIEADFAVLSPLVHATSTRAQVPYSWRGFGAISQFAGIPVYVAGDPQQSIDVAIAQAHGAWGVIEHLGSGSLGRSATDTRPGGV